METAARVVLGAFVAVVLVHYLQGGTAQANAYLRYVFSGTVEPGNGWKETGRGGVGRDSRGRTFPTPTIKKRETLPDGTVIETETGKP